MTVRQDREAIKGLAQKYAGRRSGQGDTPPGAPPDRNLETPENDEAAGFRAPVGQEAAAGAVN